MMTAVNVRPLHPSDLDAVERIERGYTLEVRVSNETAIDLYQRLGFVETGVRRGYYTDNREDALIMWRDPSSPA